MNANPFEFSFPPAPDWAQTQAQQEEALAERGARLVRLAQEAANLQERTEALMFKLKMGMISAEEFDNNTSSHRERIEAVEAEMKGEL